MRGIRPVRVLTLGVFGLAGLLFWTSFHTAQGVNLRTDDSMLRLSDLIQERDDDNAELDRQTSSLRDGIDDLAERDSGGDTASRRRMRRLEDIAGTSRLGGAGLTVTLQDAPPDAQALIPGVPEPQPDDLVIHQQDVQAVVNALWQGGAEGIRVMDQRLISTSAVRCVGNTLILQGRVYSPPYAVTAVGDPDELRRALDASPSIQNYQRYVAAYGLGWKVAEHDSVTLPGYAGTVGVHVAEPVG
ncbi:hypothetical protein SRB5_28280 [Streptomyces sp. RB5]|uniref:DUF881 domain-containing protein n=1 Tax=Streptomyces smaragdinus TaxID=2585196 RepID=A0A7K0CGT0_9ACTN|nr:DUF881 domain-containing protein [Streptomyces smaragdinus]MQY12690.1 hypothetical protein [Streptomyces smaragdinus]